MLQLNEKAVSAARQRIHQGQYADIRSTRIRPLEPADIADYIDRYGWEAYASWFIAVDTNEDEYSAFRYKFMYGDLKEVSKIHLERSLREVDRYGDYRIESAISDLLKVLDED